jgi:hypothetical protein
VNLGETPIQKIKYKFLPNITKITPPSVDLLVFTSLLSITHAQKERREERKENIFVFKMIS